MNFKKIDIDDYRNRLTEEQEEVLISHCNKHNIKPNICAWYDDSEDFKSDWCEEIGYSEEEAFNLLVTNEFITFKDNQIVRLVL